MIYTAKEISAAMAGHWDNVLRFVEAVPDERFERGPEGKWTPGQHVEHLVRCAVPLRKALGYPGFVLRLMVGKPNRPSRAFDEVHARYNEVLAGRTPVPGPYDPPAVPLSRKAGLLATYAGEKDRMILQIGKWKEKSLDQYLMPHPLLGKITVREMLFFTAFHTEHHLQILHRDHERT